MADLVRSLPEIYQLEVASVCNMECIMCPNKIFSRSDKTPFLSLQTLDKMILQGDFANSYFVELQLSGEPLLHPQLEDIIDRLKQLGLLVGLSTNGMLIPKNLQSLAKLDAITVSVDSVTNYKNIRITKVDSFTIVDLCDNIELLLTVVRPTTTVDLQIIELSDWDLEFDIVYNMFRGKNCTVRTVPDCYKDYVNGVTNDELCLNPWSSVSIHANGNVGPCCVMQGDDVVYGNVNDSTLSEIWNGSEVAAFRKNMRLNQDLPRICQCCTAKSPTLFHRDMLSERIRNAKNYISSY